MGDRGLNLRFEDIVGAVENYRDAMTLGDHFQGGDFLLGKFLMGITNGKKSYLPGFYDRDDFDRRNFDKSDPQKPSLKETIEIGRRRKEAEKNERNRIRKIG